jgi:hypothetical protein
LEYNGKLGKIKKGNKIMPGFLDGFEAVSAHIHAAAAATRHVKEPICVSRMGDACLPAIA